MKRSRYRALLRFPTVQDFPQRPDHSPLPPSLLSNGYVGFPSRVKWEGVKLATHLQLPPRSSKMALYFLYLLAMELI